jgi:TrmH family RNA methyltransferase
LEGEKLALEALETDLEILAAAFSPQGGERGPFLKAGLEVLELSENAFKAASDTKSPQGILLELALPKSVLPAPGKLKLALAAERVQDPGNLGSLLRSAWAAGAQVVYLGDGCADPFSPKVLRSASGAQLRLAVEAKAPLLKRLKELEQAGVQCVALEPEAKLSLWQADFRKPSCLVLGSEGQGLSREILKACSVALRLEMPGNAESLNVAVAGSIALFECLRQRNAPN